MQTCIYCNKPGGSKEHIWPKSLIKRMPSYKLRFQEAAGKVFAGEQTINDVCVDCNNTWSSKLDEYICSMYDLYFGKFVEQSDSVSFVYDYNNLLRWVLKISYNSSRTTGNDAAMLSKYKQFIKGDGNTPKEVFLFVELTPPWLDPANEKIYPTSARCGRMQLSVDVPWATFRVIAINSYYFYVMICDAELPKKYASEVFNLIEQFPGRPLLQDFKEITLTTSNRTNTFMAHEDHVRLNWQKYEAFRNK